MNANNHTACSLAARLAAETSAHVSDLERKAAQTVTIAAAYDAHGYGGRLPSLVRGDSRANYRGDVGTLHFDDVAPDELAALARSFPPISCTEYVHRGSRSFRPGQAPDDATECRDADGIELATSAGLGYPLTLRASWSTLLPGGVQVCLWVNVRVISFLHPRTSRESVKHLHEVVRFTGPTSLHWPDNGKLYNDVAADAGLWVRLYAPGSDTAHGSAHIRGADMLALFAAWETEANRRGAETVAAYRADAARLTLPALTRADVDDLANRTVDAYRRENLRSGSPRQYAALASPQFAAVLELAQKHWKAWADDHGIERPRYSDYFSHYTVALWFLESVGLNPDPDFTYNGAPYRYGSAWVKLEGDK